MDQDDDDESVDIEKTKHHTDERGGRNSFRRKRFSRALSGLSIETSMRSLSTRKNGDQLSSRKQNNERSELLDSIRWLGRHIGGSVFSFLIEQTQNEGAKLIEELDRSMSSLGASTPEDIASGKSLEKLGVVEKMQNLLQNSIPSVHFETDDDSSSASSSDEPIPPASKLHSALLFVDISGFTKFSTSLNVELLSKTINLYFQMIIREVEAFGGDVIKFAGDALIAEWQAIPSSPLNPDDNTFSHKPRNRKRFKLNKDVVLKVALCAANIVNKCSDYPIYDEDESKVADLNVYCGIGFGPMIGIHVGDDERKEYLLLGNPLKQVGACIEVASAGEVVISSKALEALEPLVDFDECVMAAAKDKPKIIAAKTSCHFRAKGDVDVETRGDRLKAKIEQGLAKCDELALKRLQELISLYVHPSAVQDEKSTRSFSCNGGRANRRHKSKAELRGVFTLFINPLIEADLTGPSSQDIEVITLLNKVMLIVNAKLSNFNGHLRQFILDDKGLVLIVNFGLRGSTFPDMIERRALPFSLIVRAMFKTELGLDCRMGATYGNAYCGVVGAIRRHEYAVLGPSVNLAARLMAHPLNRGFLVDEEVRKRAGNSRLFEALEPVMAKGYDDPVPIFVPTRSHQRVNWQDLRDGFVGRENEMEEILSFAKLFMSGGNDEASMLVVSAEEGAGKSSLLAKCTEEMSDLYHGRGLSCCVSIQSFDEGSAMVCFSVVRKLFLDILVGSQEALDVNFVKEEILCYSSHGDNQTQASKLLVKLVEICREAHVPDSYTGIICQMILTRSEAESLEWAKNVSTDTVAWFLLRVFLRIGASSDIAIVALDDISYMDELSWKFVELLFDHSKHTIILGTSRPVTSNDANIYGDFWSRLNRREYERRFAHVRLLSMQQSDVNRLIASKLGIELHAVNSDIASEIFVKSGGRPALVIEIFQKSFSKTIEAAKNPTILKFKSSDEVKNGDNISDHILQQLDALPSEVQILLNLLALLGSSFELLHVVTIMEEYNGVKENDKLPHAESILLNLDVAVEEGILIAENEAGHPTDHPGIRRNTIFRFSHDLWRKSILKLSLEDWKRKMQTIILDSRGQDTTLLLELLPLWTLSAARNESMEILLKICDKLALAGRHEQCIKLLGAELENHKIDEHAALDDDVFNFIVLLHVAMGKSYMALLVFDSSRESFLSGLKTLERYPQIGERLLILRVASGMFETARFTLNDSIIFARSLVQRFSNELASEQHNEHYLRSLAMKAELLALRGKYDFSLRKCNELRDIYNAKNYSHLLSRNYGHDHCCQCIAQSALWSLHLQRLDEAAETCDFVTNTLLPSVDPRNAGQFFLMVFPVILVMIFQNRAKEAKALFEEFVVQKSDDLLGKEGKSPDRPVHQAILILLDLLKADCSVDEIQTCTEWALAEDSGIFSNSLDLFTGSAGRTARSITAEICLRLSQSEHVDSCRKPKMIQKGLEAARRSRELIGTAETMSHALLELEPIYEKLQEMNDTFEALH